jgi:hypothetical protein
MLEITGNDIAALNDEDLRSLVGRLCESELRSRGLSTSAVTWGGNQNAPDGGIDVRVKIEDGEPPGGFVPRASVGFQVKKTDFTPGLIGPEMRPSGQLRDSITGLVDVRGAYIIASSGSDTSDSALEARLNAMRSAVADKAGHEDLLLDFYDRSRLATWTRNHLGLVLWIRQQIGRSVPGWQPYSSWAVSPEGLQDEYLLDDKARLHTGIADEHGIDVTQGIDRIRDILREPRNVVRLAGLSGVGKTRLVQALFDAHVGNNPLDPALVFYTDMNDNPLPQPTGMISDLIASRTRAIVVVDNCAPDLHRRITEFCQASDSLISAITIEYDVQEDEPEGTEVFRLEPSSVELVSKLIARRFPKMTDLDIEKIAEFSGGNARVALALANTLEHNESVAGLRDEELFKRLFYQRQEHDDSLLKAAKTCALLYSFQGEALSGDEAELPKIAALVGMDAPKLFAKVAQLKQRDLVQRRGVWRAILPHAIANRVATMALREIPLELIEQQFNTYRLMKSFSRRLGYLHESDEAKRLSEKWLAKDGLLANLGRLNDTGIAIFENVAPVSPEASLTAIERELSGGDAKGLVNEEWRRDRIATVLRSIAYDASLFDRCVAAMTPLAIAEQSDQRIRPVLGAFKTLFHIIYSGTHATIEQRVRVAERLLSSTEPENRVLGIELMQALFEIDNFSLSNSFEFGARVRDYGYSPDSRQDEAHWYATTLLLARRFSAKNDENASIIRSMVAQSIWRLWFLAPEVQEQFEAISAEIAADGYWHEGWIAVRNVLSRFSDAENEDTAAIERLRNFDRRLRPKNIAERVQAVVLSNNLGRLDYADSEDDGEPENPIASHEKAYAVAEELGRAICGDQALFAPLLPDLVRGKAARLFPFGRGLALASVDHRIIWDQLTQAIAKTEVSKRNGGALGGFLNGLSTIDQQLCETLLEEAITHQTLGVWFPGLQSSVTITPAGADRLRRAAGLAIAPPGAFHFLGWERSADAVTARDLQTIVMSLAKQEHGYQIAIDILGARLHSDEQAKSEFPSELIDAGRKLLSSPDFTVRDNMFDYHLYAIANVCLRGAEGSAAAKALCERIRQGTTDHTFHAYHHEQLISCIFKLQPRIALDVFFGSEEQPDGSDLDVIDLNRFSHGRSNALDGVPMEEILRWCDERPAVRYPTISRAVSYQTASSERGVEWTPLAIEMLKRAPEPLAVLKAFVKRFSPKSWSGSLAAILETRLGLLDRLVELKNSALEDYATEIRPKLVRDIAQTRKWEDERDSVRDERFE